MSDLLTTMAKALVDDPDQVQVEKAERGNVVVFSLKVAPEDMGKVIGKGGRRANALRAIVKAQYLQSGKKVVVDIVE